MPPIKIKANIVGGPGQRKASADVARYTINAADRPKRIIKIAINKDIKKLIKISIAGKS